MEERRVLIGLMYYSMTLGSVNMLRGKVVIDFEYDEKNEKCRWDLRQEGKDTLKRDDLLLLFQHLVGELMEEE
jgi:flagellar basal body-associated protein FliL